MHLLSHLATAAGLFSAASLAAPITEDQSPNPAYVEKRANKFQYMGVNLSGPEFGGGNLPGTLGRDYTWPTHAEVDYFTSKRMNIFRINTMMERMIQGSMYNGYDAAYMNGLKDIVNYITSKGATAAISPHNFGRYYNNIIYDTNAFKAFWKTIAAQFKGNCRVMFDTSNEYHDMSNTLVTQLNQAAIDGIRSAGATCQTILIEGNSWTGAWVWVSSGTGDSLLSLHDPNNNLLFEMHQYLDSDGSGTGSNCVSSSIGQQRVQAATQWLKSKGKRAILGEFAAGANSNCYSAVSGMLNYMSQNTDVWKGAMWWSAGPWWGSYFQSIENGGPANGMYMPLLTSYAP